MLLLLPACAPAEQIPVRHVEGTLHGFVAVHTQAGELVGEGDLSEVPHGSRVTLRMDLRFKDGSVDDETTVFTQRGTFQLISDHHIQKGPFFPHPLDMTIDARSGQVTIRSTSKDGKPQVDVQHMNLPPDLANGLTFVLPKNLPLDAAETDVTMLSSASKPRLVKLAFSPRGEEPFSVAGFEQKAMRYEMKVDLGGVAAVVAPVIGKQPPNMQMWIVEGDAPVIVKQTAFLYEGGPVLTFEMASPVWPKDPDSQIVK